MSEKVIQPEGNFFNKYDSRNFILKKIMNGFFNKLKHLLSLADYRNIIDVGCGEGYVANYIYNLNNNIKVEGMDVSPKVISICKEKFPHIEFNAGSILTIERQTNQYDMVIACEVLEHIEKPEKALEELFRISNKYVLISVPNEPIWRISNFLRGKYIRNLGNTPGHIQHWSKKGIVKLVEKYGKVLKVHSPFPWTMLLCEKFDNRVRS